MATFTLKLGSGDGKVVHRQAQGRSAAEVKRRFRNEGYYVFSVSRRFDLPALFGVKRKVPAKQFILFNKELRGLVRAGLPIVEGLRILLNRMKKGRLRAIVEQVRDQLTRGDSLSEAFGAFGDAIPRYYPALLLAGEQSGNLEEVLDRFIDQEDRIRRTRKRFYQALYYPAILICAALVAVYIIITRALPEFTALYQDSGQELPRLTEYVMQIGGWLSGSFTYLLIGVVVLFVGLRLYMRSERGSQMGETLLRGVPLAGRLWGLHNQNIFVRTMRMLITGGLPIPRALEITSGAVPSTLLARQLLHVHQEVVQGKSLQDSLEQHTRMHDMVGEMVRIGESTGTLPDMLEHLAEHGEEQAQDLTELISTVVAPIILLVMGLIIALLVLAMYLPMFGATNLIGV